MSFQVQSQMIILLWIESETVVKIKQLDRVKRIWCLSPMRAAKVQASLRIRAVSPEPSLLAYTSSGSRGTFRQKARSQASLNGWACAVKICHDGMLEDTNSLDGAQLRKWRKKMSNSRVLLLSTNHSQMSVHMSSAFDQELKSTKNKPKDQVSRHHYLTVTLHCNAQTESFDAS